MLIDMEVYKTIIWDLADCFAGQWNTLELETFPLVLARGRVHCIVLPTFPIGLRESTVADGLALAACLGAGSGSDTTTQHFDKRISA